MLFRQYILKRIDIFAGIAVFLAGFAFYIGAIDGEFVFDDMPLISQDPFYHDSSNSTIADCFQRTYWRKELSQGLYRPLTLVTYLLNAKFAELYSPAFRFVNILIHAFVSLLVYILCLAMFKERKFSFFCAILFAVHPLHSEAVIPGSGRADMLCASFIILGFLFHISRFRWKVFAVFAFALFALLCKENGIVLLFICLAYDFFFHNCEFRNALCLKGRKLLYEYLVILSAVIIYFLMRIYFISIIFPYFSSDTFFSDNQLGLLGFWKRLPSALWLQLLALWKFIYPEHLAHDYSYAQIIPITEFRDFRYFALAIFFVFISIFTVYLYRENRKISLFCLCAYVLSILPVSNILTATGTIFGERLYYFPSIWLFMILISELDYIVVKFKIPPRTLAIFASIAIFALYARLTIRISDWKDLFSIASAGVRNSPLSHKMWNNYALQLFDKGMFREAEEGFSRAVEINPSNLQALRNRAYVRIKLGKKTDALNDLKQCIELGTNDIEVYNKAGALCAIEGNKADAVKFWRKSLQIKKNQRRIMEVLAE